MKKMLFVLTQIKHLNVVVRPVTIKDLTGNASKVGMLFFTCYCCREEGYDTE